MRNVCKAVTVAIEFHDFSFFAHDTEKQKKPSLSHTLDHLEDPYPAIGIKMSLSEKNSCSIFQAWLCDIAIQSYGKAHLFSSVSV